MTEYSRLIKIGMWKWIISLYQIQLHELSFSFFHRRQILPRAVDWYLICFIFRDKESTG